MKEDQIAQSLSEFIEKVVNLTEQINQTDRNPIYWFRGEANVKWPTSLIPGAYRNNFKKYRTGTEKFVFDNQIQTKERNIKSEFIRKATPILINKKIEATDWNIYYLMQHYKINTRLLDWTENALVALYFAISDKTEIENNAVIWILQPFELNHMTLKRFFEKKEFNPIIPHGNLIKKPKTLINKKGVLNVDELTRRYLKMCFSKVKNEEKEFEYFPLAIYPTYLDERIMHQKGCFTIFGNKVNGLLSSKEKSNYLDKIIIPADKKASILKQLNLLGIDESSVYPDLDGIGSLINSKNSFDIKWKE
nr:FRG domain-containing protein [uncultured Carboxylicivirga sp.]